MEEHKAIEFQKKRDFSNKLNATFVFVRENFKSFFKANLFIAGPPVLVASLLMSSFITEFFGRIMGAANNPSGMMDYFLTVNFWVQIGSMFVFVMISYVAIIATTNNYMILYFEKKSNQIEVQEVWLRVRDTLGMYFGTVIMFGVLTVIGYVVMVMPIAFFSNSVPAIGVFFAFVLFFGLFYFLVAASLVFPIRAFEKKDFFGSLLRSFYLIRGKWWSTFGLVFVLSLLVGVVSYVFSIPASIIQAVNMLHSVEGAERFSAPSGGASTAVFVLNALAYVSQLLLYFLPTVGLVFQYFNLVEMKESKGLISKIDTIGKPQAPPQPEERY